MPKYSKLQEKALELLDYKINFKRGIETATKHATKHDVNVKNSDEFLGHITKYKNEIRELVGEVKQANLPRSTSPEAAPTPDKSNSTKCGAHKRGGAGQVRVRKQLLGNSFGRVNYQRLKLRNGSLLSLEPEVINAIKHFDTGMDLSLTIKSSSWCDEVVENWVGDKLNNAAIIRCSVISELLKQVKP